MKFMKVKAKIHVIVTINFFLLLGTCTTTGTTEKQTDEDFQATDTMYEQTFAEAAIFLKKIDEIVKKSDFESWKKNVTAEYLSHFSSPEVLKALSEKPRLKTRNIELKSLKDYFVEVFIPARTDTQSFNFDKLEFISAQRIKAFTLVDGVPYLLYLLEKDENNQWKIGVW